MAIHTLTLVWQDINIDITHDDSWTDVPEFDHYIQHIAIQRRDEGLLPITSTGDRSHFMYGKDAVQPYSTVINFVKTCLDEAAESKEWKSYLVKEQQLTLF